MSNLYRAIPSTDVVLGELEDHPVCQPLPRPLVRDLVNEYFDRARKAIADGRITEAAQLELALVLPALVDFIQRRARPHFRRVINATGVVVHTNMGRSLLAPSAVEAVAEACGKYSNLEFDLSTGERGSRYSHVEDILCKLTGAEAALVVNNNAAAVLITLDTLAKGREVIVSRGQLVEIGGSFRIPEVMEKSGATLVEVGATNRTHPRDYENAVTENTAALLRVHTSNYRIIGFTKDVSLEELQEIGSRHDLPVIEDLGSGNLHNFSGLPLLPEPMVQDVVAEGADVVSFSGDKVLGGPQAGIIVGKKKYIDRIKKNPMNRALRIDKMTLAALEATLRLYLDPELARSEVPTLAMITATEKELSSKARRLVNSLKKQVGHLVNLSTAHGESRVGGGSFPEQGLPTRLVRVEPKDETISARELKERLLDTDPPMVGRLEDDAFHLDPRTLAEDEIRGAVAEALYQALA